jgi:hypothetical protein
MNKEYVCESCDFVSNNKYHYQRHLTTKKHELLNSSDKNEYTCECGRKFRHKSSYSRHRNACENGNMSMSTTNNSNNNDALLEHVLKMNQNTLQIMSELQKNNSDQQVKNFDNFLKLQEKQTEIFKEAIKSSNNTTTTTNVQLNNSVINGQKTIQFLNQNLPDMIDIDTFINNYKGDYHLNENETRTLLESYQLNGVKGYAKCLSFFLKDNCNRQLKDKNIEYPKKISFPLTLTDSNLRSIKVKTENGWGTTTDDQALSRIIIISNDQVYLHHKTCIYLPENAKNTVLTYIKKDNPFQKIKNSFTSIKD